LKFLKAKKFYLNEYVKELIRNYLRDFF
jgi:hypothetical protein